MQVLILKLAVLTGVRREGGGRYLAVMFITNIVLSKGHNVLIRKYHETAYCPNIIYCFLPTSHFSLTYLFLVNSFAANALMN